MFHNQCQGLYGPHSLILWILPELCLYKKGQTSAPVNSRLDTYDAAFKGLTVSQVKPGKLIVPIVQYVISLDILNDLVC